MNGDCHACGTIGRTYPARRVVRSGRNRAAQVQTQFCKTCVWTLCGICGPETEWEPLTMAQVAALEREARRPNRGSQAFTADDVLRLIATIMQGRLRESERVGVVALAEQRELWEK